MSLVANTYATKLMDKQMRAREFDLLTRVLGSIPLRRVTPHADPERIPELCNTILNDFRDVETRGNDDAGTRRRRDAERYPSVPASPRRRVICDV
jgi:hypothetical protein